LYIFPGLVDFNVSLHLGNDWEDVEETTELLAAGGVTTLVCQPLLMKEEHLRDEPSSIKHKKERI
jgi:dihydroorotase-like cyclic amidohydrolase